MTASDVPDLLTKFDGRTVDAATGAHRLATAHAPAVTLEPDWRSQFLAGVTNPNIALIVLTIGMYGLFFEFANPGFVLPGVAGAIALLVGLFALQLLPINYAGLALIFLGLGFLIAEAFLPTFGTLGFGDIAAFAIGAVMLIDTDIPGYGIPLPIIAALMAFSVREVPDDGLLLHDGKTEGWARVHGERWRVSSAEPHAACRRVRVTGRRGLMLTVVPVADQQQGEPS